MNISNDTSMNSLDRRSPNRQRTYNPHSQNNNNNRRNTSTSTTVRTRKIVFLLVSCVFLLSFTSFVFSYLTVSSFSQNKLRFFGQSLESESQSDYLVEQEIPTSTDTNEIFDESGINTIDQEYSSKKEQRKKVQDSIIQRNLDRKKRTTPPAYISSLSSTTENSTMHKTKLSSSLKFTWDMKNYGEPLDETIPEKTHDTTENSSFVCGKFAQVASQVHPQNYPSVLNLNKSSKVLIMGVLNTVGFHLALELWSKCGVNYIYSIDQMMPNTRKSRMEYQSQIAILKKYIPNFNRIVVPYVGIESAEGNKEKKEQNENGESTPTTYLKHMMDKYNFTHIVHLGSFIEDGRPDLVNYGDISGISKFGSPPFHTIRHSTISMEQILETLSSGKSNTKSRPHFSFISSTEVALVNTTTAVKTTDIDTNSLQSSSFPSSLSMYGATMLMNELLASSYNNIHGIQSIGIRVPTVYGPWSRKGSALNNILEYAIKGNFACDIFSQESSSFYPLDTHKFLYVNDVVDAFIAGMQFQTYQHDESSNDMDNNVFTLLPSANNNNDLDFHSFTQTIQNILQNNDNDSLECTYNSTTNNDFSSIISSKNVENLGWEPSTTLETGILKTILWQYKQLFPYGQPTSITSSSSPVPIDYSSLYSQYSKAEKNFSSDSSSNSDLDSYSSSVSSDYPCISECSYSNLTCTKSKLFDDNIQQIVHRITENCIYAIYTYDLDPNMKSMEFAKTEKKASKEQKLCKIIFVSKFSPFVKELIATDYDDDASSSRETEAVSYKNRNGYLKAFNEWTVVWLDIPSDTKNNNNNIPHSDFYLLKLNPGKLLHPNVKRAMYFDSSTTHFPGTKLLFDMIKNMNNKATRRKTDKKTGEIIPPQPARRNIMVVPEWIPSSSVQFKNKKFSISDVIQYLGAAADNSRRSNSYEEPSSLKRQRQFYDAAAYHVNDNTLRSVHNVKKDDFVKQWVRSIWVIHDFSLEESRQLR